MPLLRPKSAHQSNRVGDMLLNNMWISVSQRTNLIEK